MQAAIGIAYVVLNGLFWVPALVFKYETWDLSLYKVENITPRDASEAENTQRCDVSKGRASFTRTLLYAIQETGDVGSLTMTGVAPRAQNMRSVVVSRPGKRKEWKQELESCRV